MSRIRSKGNRSTEQRLRMLLVSEGIRGWTVAAESLPGKPDFAFTAARLLTFVDGCFWHGCPMCYRRPQSNQGYWIAKVDRNKARDRRLGRQLRSEGWSVLRIWEHELKNTKAVAARIRAMLARRARAR